MSELLVPVHKKHNLRTSCDCPTPLFKLIELNGKQIKQLSIHKAIQLFNEESFTLAKHEIRTLYFNRIFITSKPTLCLIYGEPFLYKRGISYKISVLPTNNSNCSVIICNHSNKTLFFREHDLCFYGMFVYSGIPF